MHETGQPNKFNQILCLKLTSYIDIDSWLGRRAQKGVLYVADFTGDTYMGLAMIRNNLWSCMFHLHIWRPNEG